MKTAEEWATHWDKGAGKFSSDPGVFVKFLELVQSDAAVTAMAFQVRVLKAIPIEDVFKALQLEWPEDKDEVS